MRFRAFILIIAMMSLLPAACGSVQEAPVQLSETAPLKVQETPLLTLLPTKYCFINPNNHNNAYNNPNARL